MVPNMMIGFDMDFVRSESGEFPVTENRARNRMFSSSCKKVEWRYECIGLRKCCKSLKHAKNLYSPRPRRGQQAIISVAKANSPN